MSEMHTNTDTDADKYILNGVGVMPNEFIEIVTNFLEAQHSRVIRLNAHIAELEAENAGLKERVAMLDVTAVFKSLGEMGYIEQTNRLHTRIAGLEAVINQLIEVSEKMFTTVIAAADSYDEGMREWDKIVNDWKEE